MGKFDEVNSMKRMMGLKGPSKKQLENKARRRRLSPLDPGEESEVLERAGVVETPEQRRKRRRTDRVNSVLGGLTDSIGG